jgi:ligand-binding sensor domain-containing protein
MNICWMKNVFLITIVCLIILSSFSCNKSPIPTAPKRDAPWKIFNKTNSLLVDDKVNSVFVDGSDEKWFGTNKGANKFFSETWESIVYDLQFEAVQGKLSTVKSIIKGKDGSIWFGLAGGGIRRRMANQSKIWKEYKAPNLTSDMIYSLKTDHTGNIWAGTSSGVSRCVPAVNIQDEDRWYQYNSENSLIPDEPIQFIGINPIDGTVWFGTYTMGIITYDVDIDWNFFSYSDVPLPITAIEFTYGINVWIGTYADWAFKYNLNTSEWIQYTDTVREGGLPNYFVNTIAQGPNGNIWFGTNKGLTKFNGSTWKTWCRSDSELPSDTVTSMAFDRSGNLWIGTMNGVAEFNELGILK